MVFKTSCHIYSKTSIKCIGDMMTYEVNENHFFDVLGINQIKTFSYSLNDKTSEDNTYKQTLEINLTYYDNDLNEKFSKLSMPLELSIEKNRDNNLELKNVNLFVVENQGVKLEFDLEITLSEEDLMNKEEVLAEIEVEQNLIKVNQQEVEVEKNLIKEEYQETLETSMKERDSNICINDDICAFSPNQFKTTYKKYRVLIIDDEKKIDSYSNTYMLSMEELYHAKKHNQRLIVDVRENEC